MKIFSASKPFQGSMVMWMRVRLCVTVFLFLAALAGERRPLGADPLVGEGKIFIRMTNTRPDDAAILIRLHIVPNDDQPFGWDGKTLYVGHDEAGEKPLADDKWLARNQQSQWIDIGKYMNLQGARSWNDYLSPVLLGVMTAGNKDGLYLTAEVAQGAGTKMLRKIEINKPEISFAGEWEYPWHLGFGRYSLGQALPTLGLMIPSRPEVANHVYTIDEALKAQLQFISKFPDRDHLPQQFVFNSMGRPEILKALGYNGYPPEVLESDRGDEISLNLSTPAEEQDQRFRAYLKGKGLSPLLFLTEADREKARALPPNEQWQMVHLLPSQPDNPHHFYESANFRYNLWYEEMAVLTRKGEADNPGKIVLTGANFSPHMNVWPDVRQWVDPFRAKALTMSWTEDWWWQLPEVTPQSYGFLLDGLRLAYSYHGAPMQFYIMPFKGQSPDNFRRMSSLALAHGVKIFNHFHTEDQVLTTWDYVDYSHSAEMYRAIHDVIRDAGGVEERFFSAMPRKAEVAIMLSRAGDTWDTEDLGGGGNLYDAQYNVNNEERKSIWLALRHAQIPVDLITDEDIADGKLAPYKVLYVVGSEMLASAAVPLKNWVSSGGVLYATGGGGLLDEYHQPLTTLYEMYGISDHNLVRNSRLIRPRKMLPNAKVLDTLSVDNGFADGIMLTARTIPPSALPALWYRETLQPAGSGFPTGTYTDKTVGMVRNQFGKGITLYSGILAGLDYVRPAVTPSSDILPKDFPTSAREFIIRPVRLAGVTPPVEASEPLVETQLMEGRDGRGVVLTNWRAQPIDDLVIRFPGLKDMKRVRSLRTSGPLKLTRENGVPTAHLRLEISDYLLID